MKSCRECGHQVSEQAFSCPNRGAPYPPRALAQFAIAWSLIAQIGIYLDKGYGQLVYSLAELFERFV